jgi:hypothetical protein
VLDQEEAWLRTKLVFWGIVIFIILKLLLASLLIKMQPQPLDLKINSLGCSYRGAACYLTHEKSEKSNPSSAYWQETASLMLVRVGPRPEPAPWGEMGHQCIMCYKHTGVC